MSADWFVDTNVLVYARDSSEKEKHRKAAEWMAWLWTTRRGRLSTQVLHEYYATVTHKLSRPLTKEVARQHVRTLLAWKPVAVDALVVQAAWHLEDRFGLSWWDSLIVAAARVGGCNYLLSEDMQSGQTFDGVVVVDPFASSPPQEQP